MPEYSAEELRKLYQGLPKDLRDAIVSEDTAETVQRLCQRNGIAEADVPRFAKLVGDVLLGLLPPPDFEKSLRVELGLTSVKAKLVTRETTRFIFYPVKESLSSFYKIALVPGGRVVGTIAKGQALEKKKSNSSDTYREEIG